MPFYRELTPTTTEGKRTLENLLKLRAQLAAEVPEKTAEKTLLLATWNIREFDSPAYGDRVYESYFYIAEIISKFDLVAIQEVRQDLHALYRLMDILGGYWDCIFSDVTQGTKGNNERMAFLYDTRKVKQGGLMGQLVIPPIESKDENRKTVYTPSAQVVRTPLMAGFKVGWTDFTLNTVHILYGEGVANSPERIEEINQIAKYLGKKSEDPTEWSRNLILLGDFNIFAPDDVTMQKITEAGFVVPPELQSLPSNVQQNKHYDQIAFKTRPGKFSTTGKAGVFNFFNTVFRPEDESQYADLMGKSYLTASDGKPRKNPSTYYLQYWRTFQMSDHLPMWVELKIDFSEEYLERKLGKGGPIV